MIQDKFWAWFPLVGPDWPRVALLPYWKTHEGMGRKHSLGDEWRRRKRVHRKRMKEEVVKN